MGYFTELLLQPSNTSIVAIAKPIDKRNRMADLLNIVMFSLAGEPAKCREKFLLVSLQQAEQVSPLCSEAADNVAITAIADTGER